MKSKLVSFSIALLASICLWLYVVTVVNPEGSDVIYGIPVTFSGEEALRDDENLIITSGADATINLKVSGKRATLNKLSADNITIIIDVSRIRKAGDFNMSYTITYPSDVSPSDVDVLDRSPASISFTIEHLITKTVEVKGVLDGEVAEGYMMDTMTFDFEEITIQGPEDLVNTVSYAQVILSRDNLDKTVVTALPFSLIDAEGNPVVTNEITSDVTEIEVTLPVLKYKELPLTVELVAGGGATEDDVVREITPKTITVAGDPTVLDGINQIDLGKIDLAEILTDTTVSLPIPIPNDVKNISGDEAAEVSIKIRGLSTKVIRSTTIEFINTPAGYVPISRTQMLQVTVRAPSDIIDQIDSNHLRVVADLAQSELTQEGTSTIPVTIYIDGFAQAGVIGDYSIVASLTNE